MTTLHVFALNTPVAVSHTNLTRQNGEAPDLPPLAAWLGVDALDTDQVELFPLENLGTMSLSDYIQLAFAPEESIPAEVRLRLDALSGAVLLVPDSAIAGDPIPGAEATHIADIVLAEADHSATLPKADAAPTPRPSLPQEPPRESVPPIALFALLGMAAFAALIVIFGWG